MALKWGIPLLYETRTEVKLIIICKGETLTTHFVQWCFAVWFEKQKVISVRVLSQIVNWPTIITESRGYFNKTRGSLL